MTIGQKIFRLTLFLLVFNFDGLSSQASMSKMILGLWKNCGAFGFNSTTITLYKNSSDSCDHIGPNCDQTRWNFLPDSSNISRVTMMITCSCKNGKIRLTCGQSQALGITWLIDDKKRTLSLISGGKPTVYKIKTLNKTTLELTKS